MDLLSFLSEKIRSAPDTKFGRAQYRRDMIKALINSYPEGTAIPMPELRAATQYPEGSSGLPTLLNRMIQQGDISRERRGGRNAGLYSYKVLKPGNTYDEERGETPSDDYDDHQAPDVRVEDSREGYETKSYPTPPSEGNYTFTELEELAMKHVFYHPGSSVAEFIKTLKED